MSFRFYIILLFLLQKAFAASPGKYTVSGRISTPGNNALPDASVYTPEGEGTSTDEDGFYKLSLPGGMVTLIISHVGYEPCTLVFRLQADTAVNVVLEGNIRLSDVQVDARRASRRINTVRLPMQQARALPGFMGADPMHTVRMLPGIQSAADVGGGIYVRGGSADQNLILLDGMPVYNASHLLDMFSLFNADAIDGIDVIRGGFPARYGGRVSSVIDIAMKSGDMEHFHGEGEIGLVSAKATLGGPLWKNRVSLIVSARRTYVDLLLDRLSDHVLGDRRVTTGYYFYDATARLTARLSAKDQLTISLYTGNDKFNLSDEEPDTEKPEGRTGRLEWGNLMSIIRWRRLFSSRLYSGAYAAFSRYRSLAETSMWETSAGPAMQTSSFGGEYLSGITDRSAGAVFGYIPSDRYSVRTGASATYHTFHPGELTYTQESFRFHYNNESVRSWEYRAYVENRFQPAEKLKTEFGLHWSGFAVGGTLHRMWQPRVSVCYLPFRDLSLKASYARMAQYTHLLVNSNVGMPIDLWVPSTAKLDPQTARQATVGMVWNRNDDYGAGAEAYYKTVQGVMEYREGALYIDPRSHWEDKVVQGEGRSYGIEFFVFKRNGSWTGWAGYTLSWSDRRIGGINGGRRFYYKYDRRHDVSIALTKTLGKRVKASAVWIFASGNCLTLPVAAYRLENPVGGDPVHNENRMNTVYYDYSGRNGYRMPPYHRLDLSVNFAGKKRRFEHWWVIGAYNVYCRRNPFYIDIDGEELVPRYGKKNVRDGPYRYVQYSLFPVIAYVSLRIAVKTVNSEQ